MSAVAVREATSEDAASTILVVEDEILIRAAVSQYLRDCGFSVLEAGNADDAVKLIEAGQPVDIVFTDVQMPGSMNGFQLAGWIGQKAPWIRTILTSGLRQSAEHAKALCLREGSFVHKPYVYEDLERKIRALLVSAGKAHLT